MKGLRWRLAASPILGYLCQWAVIADGQPVDFALTRRAALRRRPTATVFSTVYKVRSNP